MAVTTHITTADQLLAAGDIGRCELVRGQLHMMTPASFEHGRITHNVALAIGRFVADHDLGVMVAAETGFILEHDPDTVRAADVAFIAASRVPSGRSRGFGRIMPDLVVEVLSPDDRAADVLDKTRQWLAAGVKLVWLVDPRTRTVTVHHPDGRCETLDTTGALTAPDLLPEFTHPIAAIFK